MDNFAYILVICSAVFHAAWNCYAKKSSANKIVLIWAAQLLVGLLLVPLSGFLLWTQGISLLALFFIFGSSVIHALYVFLLGSAYEVGDMSTVYPVARGVGIVGTTILATSTGIDSLSFTGGLAIFGILIGVLVIGLCKTRLENPNKVIRASLLVGLSIASYSVFDKMAVQHISPILFVSLVHLGSALLLSFWVTKRLMSETKEVLSNHKLYSFYIGLASAGNYALILWAFQTSPASYVVALRETSILFAAVLGVVILKEKFSTQKSIGILLIVIGAILMKFA